MTTDSWVQENEVINIYVITTGDAERIGRVKHFLSGLKFEFVQSDNLEELVVLEKRYKKISHKFRQKAIMVGEIGAFKTHSKAWERIIESKKPGIIVEDNIEFIKKPSFLMSKEVVDLVDSCGLISFSDFAYKQSCEKPYIISSVPEKKPLPIVCYGITPERAFSLIKAMNKNAYVMPVDKWLSIPKLCGCNAFVSSFSIAKRKDGLASIANRNKGEKSINPVNVFYWVKNKIKYCY